MLFLLSLLFKDKIDNVIQMCLYSELLVFFVTLFKRNVKTSNYMYLCQNDFYKQKRINTQILYSIFCSLFTIVVILHCVNTCNFCIFSGTSPRMSHWVQQSNSNNSNNNTDNVCDPSENSLEHIDQLIDTINCKFSNLSNTSVESIVYNLSNYSLSSDEQSLLELGLKFCPTPPKADIGDLVHDVDQFFRSANLKLFFQDVDTTYANTNPDPLKPFEHPSLKLKSKFNPTFPPLLEYVRQSVITDLQNYSIKSVRNKNLTHSQFLAIKSLSSNPNIVIKPADKGSGIVVMNREDYIKEGERQLSDTNFYQKVDHDLTLEHCSKVSDLVNKMLDQNEISQNTAKYLLSNFDRTAQFYMLPKIHKSLQNPPGRPITSGNDCPTEKISQLIDLILQPYVPKIKSYVKDTNHFISIIEDLNINDQDAILVTLDVTSLYTNIPHKEGIEAIENVIYSTRPHQYMPKNSSIIDILKLILTCNNFQFNGTNYLQVSRTAMGTRVAPTYANLFMSDFED